MLNNKNHRAPTQSFPQYAVGNFQEPRASHFKINKQLTNFLKYYNFFKNPKQPRENDSERSSSQTEQSSALAPFGSAINTSNIVSSNTAKTMSSLLKSPQSLETYNTPGVQKIKLKCEDTNALVKAKVSILLRYKAITTNGLGQLSGGSLSQRCNFNFVQAQKRKELMQRSSSQTEPLQRSCITGGRQLQSSALAPFGCKGSGYITSRFLDPLSLILYHPKNTYSLTKKTGYVGFKKLNAKTAVAYQVKKVPIERFIIKGTSHSDTFVKTKASPSFLGYWLLWVSTLPLMGFAFFSTPPHFIEQQRHFLNNLNTLNTCMNRLVLSPSSSEPDATALPSWAKAYGGVVKKITTESGLNSPQFLYRGSNYLIKTTTGSFYRFSKDKKALYYHFTPIGVTHSFLPVINASQGSPSVIPIKSHLPANNKIMPVKSAVLLTNTFNFINFIFTKNLLSRTNNMLLTAITSTPVKLQSIANTSREVSYNFILNTIIANTKKEKNTSLLSDFSLTKFVSPQIQVINNLKLLNLKMLKLKKNPTEYNPNQSLRHLLTTLDVHKLIQSTNSSKFSPEERNNKGVIFLYGRNSIEPFRNERDNPMLNINQEENVAKKFFQHNSIGVKTLLRGANNCSITDLNTNNLSALNPSICYAQPVFYRKVINNYALQCFNNYGWKSYKTPNTNTSHLSHNIDFLKTNVNRFLVSRNQRYPISIPLTNGNPDTISLYQNGLGLNNNVVNRYAPNFKNVASFSTPMLKLYTLNRPNKIIRMGSSNYFDYINKKIKNFTQFSNLHNDMISLSKRPKIRVNKNSTENSTISILLKHKKMFKNVSFDKMLDQKEEEPTLYLDLQKKRKAKKQRLETRRQKKRIRLYPRPVWMRFRMFSDFLNRRTGCNLNAREQKTYTPLDCVLFNKTQVSFSRTPFGAVNIGSRLPYIGKNALGKYNKANKNKTFQNKDHWLLSSFNPWKDTPLPNLRLPLAFALPQSGKKLHQLSPLNIGSVKRINGDVFSTHTGLWFGKPQRNLRSSKLNDILVKPIKETKMKANYINFKTPKPESQSDTNLFRDFWVWSYNNTINNWYNSFLLSPYSLHWQKIKTDKMGSNQLYNLIRWSLSKSKNKYSFSPYNKRQALWGLQKIRNQSKNNKTILISKQLQSYWHHFGTKKYLNLFYKKIYTKMRHSLQKIYYLNSLSFKDAARSLPPYNRKIEKQELNFTGHQSLNYSRTPFGKAVLKGEALYRQTLFNSRRDRLHNIVVAPWFSSIPIKDAKMSLPTMENIFSGVTQIGDSRPNLIGKDYIPLIVGLLFHFCAIISLISISQIRCFLKFHLILIYKISNFYNLLISKISQFKFVKSFLPIKNNRKFILSQTYKVKQTDSNFLPQSGYASSSSLSNFVASTSFGSALAPKFEARSERRRNGINRTLEVYSRSKSWNINNLSPPLNQYTDKAGSIYNYSPSNIALYQKATTVLKRKSFLTLGISLNRSYLLKQKLYKLVINTKNNIVKATFNLIDLFQALTRGVSSFFEKPAEITTTWIAFGFLVEWSSDFLAIIPETIDIYVWNTFSKIFRSVSTLQLFIGISQPIQQLVSNSLYGSSLKSQSLVMSNSHMGSYKLLGDCLSIGLPLPFFIHLVQRRIAFLFDFVIKTISQPDTDLIRRQQKGNLFWDVWGDYLLTAADQYNINIAALSTIKAEQNKLIDSISTGSQNADSLSNLGPLNKKMRRLQPNGSTWKGKNWLMQRVALTPYTNNIIGDLRPTDDLSKPLWAHSSIWPGVPKRLSNFTNKTQSDISVNRWVVNQFITYQSWSNNSDLFIDYHPPKSFENYKGHFINSNITLQQPIGTLVCQIYSGLFNKQISKNILLINSSPNNNQFNNTLLIQALAGETELKIITDNAKRYAVVNRGFAIGIKLLRDVFDKIKLTTPCIFLLEDIHAIGERRPMLISDYGNDDSKNNELFQSQLDEVHEKNQVVYQSFFHAITHYKKPFKSNVTTTKYLTDLYRFLRSQGSNNLSLTVNNNTTIKPKMLNKNHSHSTNQRYKTAKPTKNNNSLSTHLLLQKSSISTYNPLLKLSKSKDYKSSNGGIPKICNEFPWGGLTGEQLATKPRISYSIRSKVSLLAEQSLSNISAKLDMITDLLVIIDSVRGSKGFVVFATTDVPHILDPALRRPGRLDETICMPNLSLDSKGVSVTKGALAIPVYQMFKILNNINSISNGCFTAGGLDITLNLNNVIFNNNNNDVWSLSSHTRDGLNHNHTAKLLIAKSMFHYSTKSTPIIDRLKEKVLLDQETKASADPNRAISLYNVVSLHNPCDNSAFGRKNKVQTKTFKLRESIRYSAYNAAGRSILSLKTSNSFFQSMYLLGSSQKNQQTNINYLTMFGDYTHIMQQVMLLFAGHNATKISQLKNTQLSKQYRLTGLNQCNAVAKASSFHSERDTIFAHTNTSKWQSKPLSSQKQKAESQGFRQQSRRAVGSSLNSLSHANQNNKSFIKGSIDFKVATTIMLAFIQKRYLYHKNLIVPKLLNFLDGQLLDEPPSPPFSNVLIPAKRFENYKRVFRDSIFADGMYTNRKSINFGEKMQYYQELSSYSLSKTKVVTDGQIPKSLGLSKTDSKYKEITGLSSDNFQTTTNMNWYFENRILKRHSQYLINQWWNGQLSEHNAESVFLSDIDWRSSFIKTNAVKAKNVTETSTLKQKLNQNVTDVFLDFPDAEQLYNPRRRRWFLTKGAWEFWFNFDKIYSQQLLNHLVLESLIKTYKYFYKNGELLDYVTTQFIKNNSLYGKETLQSHNHKPQSIYKVMQATCKGAEALGV